MSPRASCNDGERLMLACDLDGTLVDDIGVPFPGVGAAISELAAAGVLFVVVTGRPFQTARRAVAALGVDPVLYACCHGAVVAEPDGSVVRHLPVPGGPGRAVIRRALQAGLSVTVWDLDATRELAAGDASESVQDEPGTAACRLILHGDPEIVDRHLPALRAAGGRRLRLFAIRPGFVGAVAAEADKGGALCFIAARLGVALERTLACGNDAADETLLDAAGVRLAVGPEPHVLARLPNVTVTDGEHVARALRSVAQSTLGSLAIDASIASSG